MIENICLFIDVYQMNCSQGFILLIVIYSPKVIRVAMGNRYKIKQDYTTFNKIMSFCT